MHKKNLETLMKSRNEFTTNEEYNEYLRIYLAGLAMQAMISNMKPSSMDSIQEIPSNIAKWSLFFADELLKQLEDD